MADTEFCRRHRLHEFGRKGIGSSLTTKVVNDPISSCSTVTAALGLNGVVAGQRWAVPAGAPELGGVVEYISDSPYGALLRLDKPGPGTATLGTIEFGDSVMVAFTVFLYGDQAAGTVARETPLWQAWMQERFPQLAGTDNPRA